jgi:hypothetical protein
VAVLGTPLPWVRKDSRRGLFYTREWRGRTVISGWPRRRKARRSALQRQKERDFAAAVLALKWLDPRLQAAYIDRCRPSQTLWRDQLMAQLYGTAFTITTSNGQTIYPRSFHEKISRALDQLGAETGALLVRAAAQWQTLPPGAPGLVLTSRGPGLTPTWQ